ncbi:uncharacterized protein LOC114132466 isoform X1 [Aphis gossypii]|uniref:Uncharacterized protein n=2 Tax=Aphis gossypii TaxID=80765 RepID=A0A9P0NQ39_APHGO|nr:uncharacterized protein LOC114132466 isoform X1 [Aphis gossypii]CAH1732105.1 unnamed protein product [Aphis gossypii]
MKFFNYNFLFVSSFTLEFGVAVLTTVFTMLTLSVVMVNVSELSKNLIVLGSIFLLLLTWGIAITGALLRSRKLIALTIVIWTIFIIEWLVLSLYFRVLMHNINYCVAQNTRCAPTMWLIGGGATNSSKPDDDPEVDDESNSTDPDSDDDNRRRLWSIIDSPKLTVKTFHPMKTNVIPNTIATTPAVDTVISNQTSMIVGVNNGCGCERHPRTTTESPPSDLITRVIEYRKNMTMYRQTSEAAIQLQKKKSGEKNEVPSVKEYNDGDGTTREHHKKKGYDSKIVKTADEDNGDKGEDNEEDNEDDNPVGDETEEKDDSTKKTADCQLVDLLVMAFFLLLYVYALYVLLSYHNELKLMQNCKCTILT